MSVVALLAGPGLRLSSGAGDLLAESTESAAASLIPAPFGTCPFGALFRGADASRPSPSQRLLTGDVDPIEHLIWVRPYDPVAEDRVDLYLGGGWASGQAASLPTGQSLPNQLFLEVLDKPPNREVHTLSNQEISLGAVPSYGDVQITDAYREFLPAWRSYEWEGAPLRHLQGDPAWDLEAFATTFVGEATRLSPAQDGQGASLQVRDLIQRLQRPVETRTYLGLGACVKGDGASGRVTFGSAIDLGSDWSMRFRVWPDSATNSSSRMFNKDNGTTGWLAFLQNRNLSWLVRGGATVSTTGNPLLAGEWNDCFLTYSSALHQLTFYVAQDEVVDEDVHVETFSYSTGAPSSGSISMAFGARSDGASPFAGRWGHLAVFNACLTSAEVLKYRSRPLLGDEAGLVRYWPCTEAIGTVVYPVGGGSPQGTFAGGVAWAGSLTGTDSVRGKTRVGGMGFIQKREPVLVDEVDLVYEVVCDGMVGVVQDDGGYLVEDRGIRPYSYAGDYLDPYAYDPLPGEWISVNAMGLIRLGAKPSGRLQVTVQASAATDAGNIIRILALRAGLAASEIDVGALALLTTLNPAPLQIPWGLEKVTIDSLILLAASSVGACRLVSPLDGTLTVYRFGAPSEIVAAELTGDDILLDGLATVDSRPAARRVEISWGQYQSTLSSTDLSALVSPRTAQDLGQEYRVYPTPDNAAALKANATAPVITRVTGLIREIDARAEADREATFRNQSRATERIGLFRPRHDLVPGMSVKITAPIGDYDGGRIAVIVGKVIDDSSQSHELEVFR